MEDLKFILLILLIFLQLTKQQCDQGCLSCSQNNSQKSICLECEQDYLLNSENICVYQLCDSNLYLQQFQQTNNTNLSECVSVCDDMFYQQTESRTCQQLTQCSQSFNTKDTIVKQSNFVDIGLYDNYLIVINTGVISLITKERGELIKQYTLGINDYKVQLYREQVYIFTKNQEMDRWNLVENTKQTILLNLKGDLASNSSIVEVESLLGCLTILDNEKLTLQTYPFQIALSGEYITETQTQMYNLTPGKWKNMGKGIFISSVEQNLNLLQLQLDSKKQNINQVLSQIIHICEINNLVNFGNILFIEQFPNDKSKYAILTSNFQFIIIQIDQNPNKCSTILSQASNYSNLLFYQNGISQYFLIGLSPQLIDIYNIDSSIIVFKTIKAQDNTKFTDMKVGQFQSSLNLLELFVIVNPLFNNQQSTVAVFDLNQSSDQFSSNLTYSAFVQAPTKLIKICQNNSQAINYLVLYNSDFEILEKTQEGKLKSVILSNFQSPYPKSFQRGAINTVIILNNSEILAACSSNGILTFWDITSGFQGYLIYEIKYQNDSCSKLQKINDFFVAAFMKNSIQLISTLNFKVFKVISHNSPKPDQIIMSVNTSNNSLNILLVVQDCIAVFDNLFAQIFYNCTDLLILSSTNIVLLEGLKILSIQQNKIGYYQLSQQSVISTIQDIQTANKLIKSQVIIDPNTLDIDEVLVVTSDLIFYVYDKTLSNIYSISNLPFSDISSIQRAHNDSNTYNIHGASLITSGANLWIAFQKSSDKFFQNTDSRYTVKVYQPQKVSQEGGIVYHHIQSLLVTPRFSLTVRIIINLADFTYRKFGYDFVPLYKQSANSLSLDNKVDFIGTLQGFVGANSKSPDRYKEYKLNLLEQNETYQDIQQSLLMHNYFIATNSRIIVLDIHTDALIIPNLFYNINQKIIKIVINEEIQALICLRANSLQIKYFGDILKNNEYTYSGMNEIKNFMFIQDSQNFLVFGTNLVKLDLSFNVIKSKTTDLGFYDNCLLINKLLYCKQSSGSVSIIDLLTLEESKIFLINVKQPNFQMCIDKEQNNIFLYQNNIDVFDLNMNFQKQITNTFGLIGACNLFDIYLLFFTPTTGLIYLRQDLTEKKRIQDLGGLTILKYVFIKEMNSLILFGDTFSIAQIFVYNFIKESIIGKIKGDQLSLPIGLVKDVMFDKGLNFISFIDALGNYFMYDFNDPYTIQNFFTIQEVFDNKYNILKFSVNLGSNRSFILTDKSLFLVNYNIFSNRCQYFFQEPYIQFSKIFNQQLQQNDYLVLSQNQIIFKYSDFLLSYEIGFIESEIMDFQYIQDIDVLVVATSGYLAIYKSYSAQYNKLISKSQSILFQKFIYNNIILTVDKRIINYDYLSNTILKEFSLKDDEMMTNHLYISDQFILIAGTNRGRIYIYNTVLQTITILESSSNSIKSIKFIQLLSDKITLNIGSIDGQIIIVDLQKNIIAKEYDLITKIGRQNEKGILILNSLFVDEQFKRMLFHFLFEKKAYIWKVDTEINWGFVSFAADEYNQIFVGENYYFLQSAFQINIYNRKTLYYLTYIKRNTYYDQLIGFHLFSDNFIGLFFYQKIEIFFFDPLNNTIQIVDQQTMVYPKLMEYKFFSSTDKNINTNNDILSIIGFNSNGIFEKRYSTQYYLNKSSAPIQQCGFQFLTNNFFKLDKQLQSLQTKKIESYFQYGTTVMDTLKWKNFLFLANQQNLLAFLNQQNANLNEFILSSLQTNQDPQQFQEISLSEKYFEQFLGRNIQMKGVSFKFDSAQQQMNVNFNIQTDSITLSQIKFENQSILNKSITFQKKNKVIIEKISINTLSNGSSRILEDIQKVTEQMLQSLFVFDTINEVLIYDIQITGNTFDNPNVLQSIFKFINVNKVSIKKLTFENNQMNANAIIVEITDSLILDSNKINNNENKSIDSQNDISFFKLIGCMNSTFTNLSFNNNKGIQLISTTNSYKQNDKIISLTTDSIYINTLNALNNEINYQLTQLISIISSDIQLENLTYLQNSGSIQIEKSDRIFINNSKFIKNTGLNGGAISVLNVNSVFGISSSNFIDNQAIGNGGAIYIENINCGLELNGEVTVKGNLALIGGGIRIINFDSEKIDFKKVKQLFKIERNEAKLYGDDIATHLNQIEITKGDESALNVIDRISLRFQPKSLTNPQDLLQLYNVKSGGSLKLRIKFLDDTGRNLTLSKEKVNNKVYTKDILDELTSMNLQLISTDFRSVQLSGESILNYNLFNQTTNSFEFKDVVIYGNPLQSQQIQIKIQMGKQITKNILVQVNFRSCVTGEIIGALSQSIKMCQYCSKGSYSLDNPNDIYTQNQQNSQPGQQVQQIQNKEGCKKCPDSALDCEGSLIHLKNGYWRKNILQDQILECNSQIGSCKPEDRSSINGCQRGYIGPLCEVCDTYGDTWEHQFTKKQFSKGQCEQCSPQEIQTMFVVFKLFIPILYFFFSSRIFLNSFMHAQTCYYIRILKLLPLSRSQIRDESGFYLKILVSYLQFSSLLVSSFQYIPIQINFLPDFIGTSVTQFVVGIECILPLNLIKTLGKIRLICALQTVLPVFFILVCLSFLIIQNNLQKNSISNYYIYPILTVLFTFFQPEVISQFTSILTCRQIGSDEVFLYDLTIDCYDPKIRTFMNYYAIFHLTLWISIPLVIFYLLQKRKLKLNHCITKYKYGYFYMELKTEYYYWEFIRIYFKIVIIAMFTLQKQNYYNIAVVQIFIAIGLYLKQIYMYQPFISKRLTTAEIISLECILLKICVQVIMERVNTPKLEFIILITDYYFIGYIVLVIFYFKMNNRFSLFGRFTRYLFKKILKKDLYLKLTRISKKSFKTLLLWKKVHQNLLRIIELKANDNIVSITKKPIAISRSSLLKQDKTSVQKKESTECTHIFENKKTFQLKLEAFNLDSENENKENYVTLDLTDSIDYRSKTISDGNCRAQLPKDNSFIFQTSFMNLQAKKQ